jgi:hypothetical protein
VIPVKKLPGGDIHTKPKGFAKALSCGRYNYNETKMFSQTSSGNGNNLKKSMQQFNLSSSKQPKQSLLKQSKPLSVLEKHIIAAREAKLIEQDFKIYRHRCSHVNKDIRLYGQFQFRNDKKKMLLPHITSFKHKVLRLLENKIIKTLGADMLKIILSFDMPRSTPMTLIGLTIPITLANMNISPLWICFCNCKKNDLFNRIFCDSGRRHFCISRCYGCNCPNGEVHCEIVQDNKEIAYAEAQHKSYYSDDDEYPEERCGPCLGDHCYRDCCN